MTVNNLVPSSSAFVSSPGVPRISKTFEHHESSSPPRRRSATGLPLAEQLVLDAICELRAADEAYGPGDSYFGQPLKAVSKQLPSHLDSEILESVGRLLARGLLSGSRHNSSLVWVTREGWLAWTSWNKKQNYLLRHNGTGTAD